MDMIEFDYNSEGCWEDVVRAVERRVAFAIRVGGRRAGRAERALRHREAFYHLKEKGATDRRQLWLFGWYGFATASLWGMLNEADLAGATVRGGMEGSDLVVRVSFPWRDANRNQFEEGWPDWLHPPRTTRH